MRDQVLDLELQLSGTSLFMCEVLNTVLEEEEEEEEEI